MKATFLHLADVHLGNEQYGLRERAHDFARAFHRAVEYALHYRMDFLLVAGDLFERSTLDPVTFDQALLELETLKAAGMPVIAIAGNHDRARYGQGMAWLESLGRHGFLYYLDASRQGEVSLAPWSREEGWGGYLDLKGLRFVGMRYLGASTPWAVEEMGRQLRALQGGTVGGLSDLSDSSDLSDQGPKGPPDRPYTVALLHGGLDGIVPGYRAELTYAQLAPLRGLVDYVALGHIHQRYDREGWVYNPGSLETWNAGEVGWDHGFFHVAVDTSVEPRHVVVPVEPPRRPFLRYRLEVQPCRGPEELLNLVQRSAGQWARAAEIEEPPVVYLTLFGRLRFDRRDLDLKALQTEVEVAFKPLFEPLAVQIRDQTDDTAFAPDLPEGAAERLDRSALELRVLRDLFANDERRVHTAAGWARLALALKQGAVARESPERLADLVRREAPTLLGSGVEGDGAEGTLGEPRGTGGRPCA